MQSELLGQKGGLTAAQVYNYFMESVLLFSDRSFANTSGSNGSRSTNTFTETAMTINKEWGWERGGPNRFKHRVQPPLPDGVLFQVETSDLYKNPSYSYNTETQSREERDDFLHR